MISFSANSASKTDLPARSKSAWFAAPRPQHATPPASGLPIIMAIARANPGSRGRALFLKFDDMSVVVDANGAELAKDVLPQKAVELGPDILREVAKVHDRDRLRKQKKAGNLQVHAQAQRISDDARSLARQLDEGRVDTAAEFGVDDGVVGAGVEQQGR